MIDRAQEIATTILRGVFLTWIEWIVVRLTISKSISSARAATVGLSIAATDLVTIYRELAV